MNFTKQEMINEMRIINLIEDEELKSFVTDFVVNNSNDKKIIEANKVGDIVIDLLDKKGHWNVPVRQPFVNYLLAASMLHNIYYDEEHNKVADLFKLRDEIFKVKDFSYDLLVALEYTIGTVETQDGEECPIKSLIPQESSWNGLFALAVWINKRYNRKE